MEIHFSEERMAQTLESHMKWWRGELGRPLACVTLGDAFPSEKRTPAPLLSQSTCAQLEWSPEQVIEALDEELSHQEYLGDAYPRVGMDCFGPGVLAAFCGARLDNSSGAVWFFPEEEREISEIHARYDPDSLWARRIKALYRAGRERWGSSVVMSMPDLGGVMDVVATLRGSENLLMDLYDDPEEVLRLRDEVETAWYEAYADMRAAMGPDALYTDWCGLLSSEPSYVIQCDFCYMIGNGMFRQFVLDTLRRDTEKLSRLIYHLDGVGELNHLDDILALEKLDAVQWVFGDGKPGPMHWLDVYRKIRAAGKEIMIVGRPGDYLDALNELHGAPYTTHFMSAADRELAEAVASAR